MDPTTRYAEGTPLERYTGSQAGQALMLALLALGYTADDLDAAGYAGTRKDGSLIPGIGGGDDVSLDQRIAELTAAIREQGNVRNDTNPNGKAADGGRYAAALEGSQDIAKDLAELSELRAAKAETEAKAARKAEIDAAVTEALGQLRIGSGKAAALAGDGGRPGLTLAQRRGIKASPVLQEIFGEDYLAGSFLGAMAMYKGYTSDGIDIEQVQRGKAELDRLGVLQMGVPEMSRGYVTFGSDGKATLGATGATGGYVLPNNLVDAVLKPNVQKAIYRNLITVIPGVAVRGIDQPYRLGAPTRMTTADWGATKENVNESYGTYTANLVTFARIYDIGKQYLRFSAGSAERDVLDELTKAADLAENYEVIAGPGTGSTGSGDACLGIYTSLNATPSFLGYKAAKTNAASNSTVLGSFASAISEILGILAGRNRDLGESAVVVDSATYFTALAQGSDTAGFWVDPAGGPTGFSRNERGQLTYWGTPIYYDTNLTTNAASKIAIAGEWKAAKLYRGMEFRIDSSDVAGTRWDQNLVGFRGEMEMGFNAETPVHVGAFQLMTAVIP